ncbi:MAG: AbrB/MazE/SpoVT family DNA-binding domain-containing protein [Ktedonobacterales bacterium]
MTTAKLRRVGNSYVVTIPKDEVERLHLTEGDMLSLEVRKLALHPEMAPDVRAAFEESWQRDQEAYEYLKDR